MAVSDELRRLANRAEEAEKNTAAARDKAKADLDADLENSRAVAQQDAEHLREAADEGRGKISERWNDVQRSWNEHIAQLQEKVETKKAEIDVDRAEKHADHAEADAAFAVDFAYGAIGEAEYAVLDALVTRKEADEMAGVSA
jgi:hypothetical protein